MNITKQIVHSRSIFMCRLVDLCEQKKKKNNLSLLRNPAWSNQQPVTKTQMRWANLKIIFYCIIIVQLPYILNNLINKCLRFSNGFVFS